MGVPKMSSLRPGISVNMVLKADQRSGKLTTGPISEILTRGDHPRGIKVRLASGQIGRVQSLATTPNDASSTTPSSFRALGYSQHGTKGRDYGPLQAKYGVGGMEDDVAPVSRSLADYIRTRPVSKQRNSSTSSEQGESIQIRLEKQFPSIDTALIAAISADYNDAEAARSVLSSLL